MHGHVSRSIYANFYLIAANVNNRDFDIVTDEDALIALAREHEHVGPSLGETTAADGAEAIRHCRIHFGTIRRFPLIDHPPSLAHPS